MGGDRRRRNADGLVHVVAGVLSDARGRILLSRRTAGRDLAGAWEFPGGKVEPGEAPLAALERELHEELGIRIGAAEPLVAVPQAYPEKRILLDVWRVHQYAGTPRGLEKQALAWTPPEKLGTYPMPPADRPVVAVLNQPGLYAISPEPGSDHVAFLQQLDRVLEAGVQRVRLRAARLSAARLRPLAEAMQRRCVERGAQLMIGGDAAMARALGCGVHLAAAQLATLASRPLPPELPVAASCHDEGELRRAEALGVDFAVLGPVAPTATHPEAAPLGWQRFARLRECVSLPIYAIGGLGRGDLARARQAGAQGVAAIRGLWSS